MIEQVLDIEIIKCNSSYTKKDHYAPKIGQVYSNIRTPKVYMLVIAYDPDPTISGALHG